MTKLLDKAIDAVRVLSPAEQDEIAQAMLAFVSDFDEGEEIDPVDLEAIERGLDDMRNGRFATEAEMEALFRRFDK